MIIPSGHVAAPGIARHRLAAVERTAADGALTSAPGTARAHVRAVLPGWGLADLIEDCELVVSELTTNAVKASTGPGGRLLYVNGRMPVVRACLLSDGSRLTGRVGETRDQAIALVVRGGRDWAVREIPLAQITKAVVQVEFSPPAQVELELAAGVIKGRADRTEAGA